MELRIQDLLPWELTEADDRWGVVEVSVVLCIIYLQPISPQA